MARLVSRGDVRASAQALTLIENRDPRVKQILKILYPRTGNAHVVGVTGSTGSGKSTLIDCMTSQLRRQKKKVGILTVDPTSPISGGALLGDRIRMRSHFSDKEVFIRSLATRNGRGGLSGCIAEAVHLLDAMGKDFIFVETIGIGQDQIEVSHIAHTVLVVVTADSGDEVQAMKAGILEVADLLVVNKADLGQADELFLQLSRLLRDAGMAIFKTCASRNEGTETLVDGLKRHRAELLASGDHRSRSLNISRNQLLALVRNKIISRALKKIDEKSLDRLVKKINARLVDPDTAAEKILRKIGL